MAALRGVFGRPMLVTACIFAVENAVMTSGMSGTIWSTTSRGGRTRMIARSSFLRFCWWHDHLVHALRAEDLTKKNNPLR